MTYRRHEAMRFEELLWITKTSAETELALLSNKYIPSPKGRNFAHVLALDLLRLSM